MKKILSIFLIALILVMQLSTLAFAEEVEQEISEITNISPLGTPYCTSEKNSLWTPVKTIINGKYGTEDWQGWECKYPVVEPNQDTSLGFSGEYCGISFDDEYYEISSIKLNIGLHTKIGGQNCTYTVKALIDGKWVDIATARDDMAIPTDSSKYADYNAVMADKNASHRVNANLTINLDEPVNTNNIRIVVSDYAKGYPGGDVLIFPYIYEVELYGKTGVKPDFVLPEGAVASTNIAWYSFPEAPSSSNGTCPFYAIDGKEDTSWQLQNSEKNTPFVLSFNEPQEIGSVIVSIEKTDKTTQNASLEYFDGAEWKELVFRGSAELGDESAYKITFDFPSVVTSKIRITFKNKSALLQIYDIEAHLANTKTYSFNERFSKDQLKTASYGNIAMIGTPYASESFDPYSSVVYINDGNKADEKVWFSGTVDVPVYCGITFEKPQKIGNATVTVRTGDVVGRDIMHFEIQALIDGEFVKVADGKSYDGNYQTKYSFDEIETTDVRIVFTKSGGAIPNLMELELFSGDKSALPMFNGLTPAEDTEPVLTPFGDNIEKNNKISPWTYIPLIVAVIIAIGNCIFLVIKSKKKEDKNGK